jgi:hypothetical protein
MTMAGGAMPWTGWIGTCRPGRVAEVITNIEMEQALMSRRTLTLDDAVHRPWCGTIPCLVP